MKASLLLEDSGMKSLDFVEIMFKNALHEIDRLEAAVNDLQKQVDYYEDIFQKLRSFARCSSLSYGPFISIGNIYESDNNSLFADLMELLQLEEPEEGKGDADDSQ